MEWARILAYITGTVDHELLLRNEYLAAENRILRGQLKGRLKFSDAERAKLGEIGRRLGRNADRFCQTSCRTFLTFMSCSNYGANLKEVPLGHMKVWKIMLPETQS